MKFEICAVTDVGIKRQNNEDGFYINNMGCYEKEECFVYEKANTPVFVFVADGVGRSKSGEIATKTCIEEALSNDMPYDENDLIGIIDKMNQQVCEILKNVDTACTIAGMLISDDSSFSFNIGDSRVYSITQGFLNQLSTDDTISGLSGNESDSKEPLIQYLGKPRLSPNVKELRTISEYLICTDGLTDMLSLDEIEETFKSNNEIQIIAKKLIEQAKIKGGIDNISLIIIRPIKEENLND